MDNQETRNPALDPRGRLCRVKEVMGFLAVSRSKVYEMMDAGQLAYVKLGKARRIPLSAVLALIEASRVGR